jgi:membrane protein DedA with SNARE-associated domain/rhodanese-related sulfurtransferase
VNEALEFLVRHGYTVLFVAVLAEQAGLPIPAMPFLLGMGALAGLGKFSLTMAALLALVATMLADWVWYELGRRRGTAVLRFLCKISLEPDSCINSTTNTFDRLGTRALLVAKFLPGVGTMAPPMAGITKMPLWRFFLADGAGALAWILAFLSLGLVFRTQLEYVAELAVRFGTMFGLMIVLVLAGYFAFKTYQRRKYFAKLRAARITAEDLFERMKAGEELVIVDLRLKVAGADKQIMGALRMEINELERRHKEIPRDRDIVLYCNCPSEATAARAALLLNKLGIYRVRPLAGGYDRWRDLGYPVESQERAHTV